MRKQSLCWVLVVAATIGGLILWGACGPVVAEETSPAPAADKPPESQPPTPSEEPPPKVSAQEAVTIEALEKKIADLRAKLTALKSEEMEVSIKAQKILLTGSEKIKDMDRASENLFNGKTDGGLAEYRQAIAANIQMWQAFGEKVNRLVIVAKGLDRERERAPKDIQPKIQEIVSLVQAKYRSTVLKIADLYVRGGDYRRAVIFYQTAQELLPEKERYQDKDLVQRMAWMLEKLKEFRAELQLLKAYAAANPTDTTYTQKIAELEKKYGAAASAGGVIQSGGSGKYTHHR